MSRHRKTTTPLQHPHGAGDWRKPPLLNLTQLTAAPCDVNVLLTNIESTPTHPQNSGGRGGRSPFVGFSGAKPMRSSPPPVEERNSTDKDGPPQPLKQPLEDQVWRESSQKASTIQDQNEARKPRPRKRKTPINRPQHGCDSVERSPPRDHLSKVDSIFVRKICGIIRARPVDIAAAESRGE